MNGASESIIQVQDLSRRFGKLLAVDRVSFEVGRGEIFGLLGPNGSGKSTIIRMLLGILQPTAGEIRIFGQDAVRQAEAVKPKIGYMSQQFSLYSDLSVQENLDFYGRIYGLFADELDQARQRVVELVGIGNRLEQLAGTLSGGWKQRLALACSLIHNPKILFLDEPTAGIDPVARRDLWDLLFELSGNGITQLVTTHYMDEAERCTSIGYLWNSKMLVRGRPAELKRLSAVTPSNMTRYELASSDPTRALHQLRQLDFISDATLFGEKIHLLAGETFSVERIQSVIGPDDRFEIRETEPSLEDVFVTLTRAANQQQEIEPDAWSLLDDPGEGNPGGKTADSNDPKKPANGDSAEEDEPVPTGLSENGFTSVANAEDNTIDRPSSGTPNDLFGFRAVFLKEFVHIHRQPTTLFFMFVVPLMQLVIFGFAIKSQIEHIPLVVLNLDQRNESDELVEKFANTHRFTIVQQASSRRELDQAIRSGRARAGLIIPPDYAERLMLGRQAHIQILVDGSDSQVATTAENTAQLIGQEISLGLAGEKGEAAQVSAARDEFGAAALALDVRSRMLFNPDLESAFFFVPGLVGIVLQLVTLFLTSFAIVRERENGTLEQLFVTPVGKSGLMLGKLMPYSIVGIVEVLILLAAMTYIFQVPISGNLGYLMVVSVLFIICSLGLGLFISTTATNQLEAFQMAFMIMLPSVLLSGFMFPRSEMPLPIYLVSFLLPVTYLIELLRGIILREASLVDLWQSVLGLSICAVVVMLASIVRFQKHEN